MSVFVRNSDMCCGPDPACVELIKMLRMWHGAGRSARIWARRGALDVHRSHTSYISSQVLHGGSSRAFSSFTVRSQEEMEAVGARVAHGRQAGDVIFLRGDLGCGKTCFARGFIRAMTGDRLLQVTSPTYLLVNTYEDMEQTDADTSPIIHHVDLYRLETVSDVDATALGLTEAFTTGITLVEWPQRLLDTSVPAERLEVEISYDDQDASVRHVNFKPFGERWQSIEVDVVDQ